MDDVPGEQPVTGSGSADGAEAGESEDDQAAATAAPSVDELFARIRAGSESDAPAPEAKAGDAVADAPVEAAATEGDGSGAAVEASGESGAEPTPTPTPYPVPMTRSSPGGTNCWRPSRRD